MREPMTEIQQRIARKHGGGGRAMRALIEEVLAAGYTEAPFGGIGLGAFDDGAAIPLGDRWLIITTDSHVIHPIFFPGGDIGRLAVSGTLNDLAMMGAMGAMGATGATGATDMLALTSAFIIEEGFSIDDLARVQSSMFSTCAEAGAVIVTGDTKVMGRGELDGLVINTTGVGLAARPVRDCGLRPGDRLIVTGCVGDHGLAIMAARHDLDLAGALVSDVAPMTHMIRHALEVAGDAIVAMKDPTRGGLSSALHEMAGKSRVGIMLDERSIPVSDAARAAGELLGIDPLQVANEGKAVIGVRADRAEELLSALCHEPLGRNAAIIGYATGERPGQVILDTGFGRRILTESDGEPLPRIC